MTDLKSLISETQKAKLGLVRLKWGFALIGEKNRIASIKVEQGRIHGYPSRVQVGRGRI